MRLLNNNEMEIINGACLTDNIGVNAEIFQMYGDKIGGMLDSIFSKNTPRFGRAFGSIGLGLGWMLGGQIVVGMPYIIEGFGLLISPAGLAAPQV